jgi:integrase
VPEQGVVRYVTHHGLRHSYARYLRKSGHMFETISKLLGHKNTYVTQTIYVDFRDDEVIEMAKNISLEPLEKVLKK